MTLKVTDRLLGGHVNVGFSIKAEQRNAKGQRQLKDHVHTGCHSSEGKHVNQQLFMLARLKAWFSDSLVFIKSSEAQLALHL